MISMSLFLLFNFKFFILFLLRSRNVSKSAVLFKHDSWVLGWWVKEETGISKTWGIWDQSSEFILNFMLKSCPTLHHLISRIRTTIQSTNEGVQQLQYLQKKPKITMLYKKIRVKWHLINYRSAERTGTQVCHDTLHILAIKQNGIMRLRIKETKSSKT